MASLQSCLSNVTTHTLPGSAWTINSNTSIYSPYNSAQPSIIADISKYKFEFSNKKYNLILEENITNITEKHITFIVKWDVNLRIEPLDTINMLLNELTTLTINKMRDDKILCVIVLKNFKFKKISNLLTFTYSIDVEYECDNILYDNPNISIQEKRNIKINKIIN